MNKRSIEEVNCPKEKRLCTSPPARNGEKEAEKVLRELCLLFPQEKFVHRVPRVVMKHMIYSRLPNRTKADKELDELQHAGVIRMFKLGGEQESLAVLFKDDYLQLVRRRCSSSLVIQKFLSTIVEKINEISIEKSALLKAGFTEDDIKCLVQECLLTVRTASTFWFCFPGAGEFMKSYAKGRQAVLAAVRKSKYKQILQNDLQSRSMKKTVQIGVLYHIHDLIGSDLITSTETTSGKMLKIPSK